MKIFSFILLLNLPFPAYSQSYPDRNANSLNSRDTSLNADVKKTGNISFSGYIQFLFENSQHDLISDYDAINSFYIRRARVKLTYEVTEIFKIVIQPDFSKKNFLLKDSYGEINLPYIKNFTFTAGRFKRPYYEFDNSSDEKGILERSMVLRFVFPDQRDMGLKLEYIGETFPLNFQATLMNGNLDETKTIDEDSKKDIMALATYSVSIPGTDIKTGFGINTYYGHLRVKSADYVNFHDSTSDSLYFGRYLERKWFSYALNISSGFLGGTSLKCEFIKGINTSEGNSSNPDGPTHFYKVRNFAGFYASLVKNVGSDNQLIIRYDYLDPDLDSSQEAAIDDIWYETLALSWEYYLNKNLDFGMSYEFTRNEINNEILRGLKDNIFRVRLQAKF